MSSTTPIKRASKHWKYTALYLNQDMCQNEATDSSVSVIKLMYIDNVLKQIYGGNDCIIFLSFVKRRTCVVHRSFYNIDGYKNVIP